MSFLSAMPAARERTMNMISRNRSRRPWASALFAMALVTFGLWGCAGQQATLTPSVVVEKESLGRGVAVAVKTADARANPVIGQCNPTSSLSGKLTVACDPASALRTAVSRGLVDKGFAPTAPADAVVRTLTVKLTDLAYTPGREGAYLAARAKAVVSVTVDNNGTLMKRRYEGETVWRLPAEGVEPEFDRLLSMTVSKALSRMASDYELLHFLEKTVLRTRDLS